MRKKIAIICPAELPVPSVKGGAVETLIDHFLDENEKRGEQALEIIVYSVYDMMAELESKKYRNVRFKYFSINEKLKKLCFLYLRFNRKIFNRQVADYFLRKVIKDLKNEEVDKILIEGNFQHVVPIRKIKKNSQIYLHVHGDAFSSYDIMIEKAIKNSTFVITVSDFVKNSGLINYEEYKNKFYTINNCIEIGKFQVKNEERELELKERYNILKEDIVILFCGRIIKEKGVIELIEAFNKYCLNLNAKMIIVGSSGFGNANYTTYEEEVSKLVSLSNGKIISTGFIHNKNLSDLYNISDISVIPSIWNEPSGLVVLEAMAAGNAIIASNVGGIPELVDSKCAKLISVNDEFIDNLGKELAYMINNKNEINIIGMKAREVVKKFNRKRYYDDIFKIIFK